LKSNDEGFEVIIEAIEKAGYVPGKDIVLAMDAASSEFYNKEKGVYEFGKLANKPEEEGT
jgi:enolase